MNYEMIEVTREGAVATIRLDRPKALNALCTPMMIEVADALAAIEADAAIGCVILTGSERAFAAVEVFPAHYDDTAWRVDF
ncbi:MAG: enoyl-CoA hydratase-related protein, partial [Maricaulaceae bacterium]